jgi:ADP-heptose:LPS heptosyltransferase
VIGSRALRSLRKSQASSATPVENPASICVLQLGKLGDMVLTTPLFAGLRELYPAAEITLLTSEGSRVIAEAHPAVTTVIAVPGGIRRIPFLATLLRRRRFDLYIDPKDQRSSTSRLVGDMVRAGRSIVGHVNVGRKRRSVVELPPADPPGHYVDRMLAPLKILAPGRTFTRRPSIEIPREAFRSVDQQVDPGERGFIAVNVSAGSPTRYWDPAKWRALIDEIARSYSVAILSTPADRSFVDEICSMRKRAHSIRTETILEAAAVVARATAVISPDTSIIHLASAFDKPVVGLYPPIDWNAKAFAPLSTRSRMLMPSEGELLATIPVEEVMKAFREITGKK